jgi:hypothetical protein
MVCAYLRVTEANDVEVWRRRVDEEVCANGRRVFGDGAQGSGRRRAGCNGARRVEELGDSANGSRRSRRTSASIVLGAVAEGDEDELQVRVYGGRRRQCVGGLLECGDVARVACGSVGPAGPHGIWETGFGRELEHGYRQGNEGESPCEDD